MRILRLFFERNTIHTKRSPKRTYTYTKRTSVHQAVIYCICTQTVLKYATPQGTLFRCQIVFEKAFYDVVHTLPYICRTHRSNLSVEMSVCLSVAGCYLPQWPTMYVYTKRTCVHQANIYMYTKRSYTIYVRRPYLNLQRIHPCSLCKWNCIRESFLSREPYCIRRIDIGNCKLSYVCRMLMKMIQQKNSNS